MEQLIVGVILVVFGLCLGSFAGATVWRLRAKQLVEDKGMGEKVNSKEYKKLLPLTKKTFTTDRSQCLHCEHVLVWYDLLPLVSWASTRGRCRYCKNKIGWFEPLMELGVAILFVASYLLWPEALQTPLSIIHFLLWLVAGVFLAILFAYDLKWFLLPNQIIFPLIVVSGVVALLTIGQSQDILGSLLNTLTAVGVLSGLYLVLWVISKGQWVGFGDVKLGLALALLLADWQLAFLALFAANLIGCILVLPGMAMGKFTRRTRIPFGPLLIVGGIVAALFGRHILNWYLGVLL